MLRRLEVKSMGRRKHIAQNGSVPSESDNHTYSFSIGISPYILFMGIIIALGASLMQISKLKEDAIKQQYNQPKALLYCARVGRHLAF